MRYTENQIRLSWTESKIIYCGCRTCSQSTDFEEWTGQVIAILDQEMMAEQFRQDRNLYINWLTFRKLFDFDKVEIVKATDEDVERFAVQIGNDTDAIRQPRYKQMGCSISERCKLSQNTLRVLEKTFGQIESVK